MDKEEIKRAAIVIGESDQRVSEVILFGSYARGQQKESSDIDLVLVVKRDRRSGDGQTEVEILAEVNLEGAGFRTQGKRGAIHAFAVLERDIELARRGEYGEGLLHNIVREGQVIWDKDSSKKP